MYDWHDKFQVIIGNPPYIKEYTNKSAFDGLHDSPYYQGKMDLWTLFACQAIDKLNDGGHLSFIAPNNWLTNAGASIFRNKILKEGEILKFIDFGDFKVFKDAGIQTMIFVFKKCTPRQSYEVDYCKIDDKGLDEEIIKGFIENDLQEPVNGITKFKAKITPSELENSIISFLNNQIDVIIEKIKNAKNVTRFENKEVAQGIVGAPDDCYLVSNDTEFTDDELNYVKIYHTSVSRYEANQSDKRIFYICNNNFKNNNLDNFKNIFEHFEKHKDVLVKAKQQYGTPTKPYFYLHRERDERFFKSGEKIVSGIRVERPAFYYTLEPFYGSRALNFVKTDRFNYKFLTGLLNSNLVAFWLKYQGKLLGNLYQVDKEPLLNIPIAVADEPTQAKIAQWVDEIIEHKKALKSGIENALDAIKIKYNLATIPNKLNEFYKMGINPFINELEALGVEISLDKIETLNSWYKEKSDKFNKLEKSITNIETAINQEVYKFYGLTYEEINIIEGM
jgi:adenine-specific DNA-methyltransferase